MRSARPNSARTCKEAPASTVFHGWRLHKLSGDLQGYWSVMVSGNWRLTFMFEGEDAILVDYKDYHWG